MKLSSGKLGVIFTAAGTIKIKKKKKVRAFDFLCKWPLKPKLKILFIVNVQGI